MKDLYPTELTQVGIGDSVACIVFWAGHLRLFSIFIEWKLLFFTFPIKWIWLGIGYFIKPGPEIAHFYNEISLKVTFLTIL